MNKRKLGKSDLYVSEIALGSWMDRNPECVAAAFDVGINFFDTANAYAGGHAEEAWGETLSGFARESYILATKAFFPMSDLEYGLSAVQIHQQVEGSLRRLRTDYIDVFYCHRFDVDTPIEETLDALATVVAAGKVRHLGFSEWQPEQIGAALAVPGAPQFIASQPQYSMIWRAPEAEIFPVTAEHGISNIVWSPLAEGLLTGKYQPNQPAPSGSRATSDEVGTLINSRLDVKTLTAVQELVTVASDAGLTMVQLALAWVLRRPEVSAAVVGASRPEHVRANALGSGVKLTQDVLDKVDRVLGDIPVTGTQLAYGARPGILHRTAT